MEVSGRGIWIYSGGSGVNGVDCRMPGRCSGKGIVECSRTLPTVLGKLRQGKEGGRMSCFTLHCVFHAGISCVWGAPAMP